jgi:uncharacterized glyoxalase superfamily protein PhnB
VHWVILAILPQVTDFDALYRIESRPEPKCPDGSVPPGDKVMHLAFTVGESMIMASDGFCSGKPVFNGFSLSYLAKDKADAKKRFDALSAGVDWKCGGGAGEADSGGAECASRHR